MKVVIHFPVHRVRVPKIPPPKPPGSWTFGPLEGGHDPKYGWWFRLWHNGPGLQRRKGQPYFSERYGYVKPLFGNPWRIFWLERFPSRRRK